MFAKIDFLVFLVCLKVKLLENNGVQILGPLIPLLRASYVFGHFGTLKHQNIFIFAKVLPLIFEKIGSDIVLDDAESKDTYKVTRSTFNQVLVAR